MPAIAQTHIGMTWLLGSKTGNAKHWLGWANG